MILSSVCIDNSWIKMDGQTMEEWTMDRQVMNDGYLDNRLSREQDSVSVHSK